MENRSSLVDDVEEKLVNLFHKQKLKVGDSIPKEMELADLLKVSRTSVREALLRLRVMGLIDSRRKRGSVITSPDIFTLFTKAYSPQIMDEETLRDIFEIRIMLEIGMADFIMERVTKEDIDELKDIVKQEPDLSDSYHFQSEHEIRFHGKLYSITNNNSLKEFQKMLLPVFGYVHENKLFKKNLTVKKFVSHKGLVGIIEHGSPEMLRNAIRNHFENHFARLFP